MARGRPPKPRPDGSNVTSETFLTVYDEAVDAKAVMDSARGKYQAVFKKAEQLGINRAMLSQAIKAAAQDRDKREINHRDYVKYMRWLNMPLGGQFDMDLGGEAPRGADDGEEDGGEQETPTDEAAAQHRLKEAEREGFDAGKMGADLGRSNPFQPGSEEAQRFSTGWTRGQADAVSTMAPTPGRTRRIATPPEHPDLPPAA